MTDFDDIAGDPRLVVTGGLQAVGRYAVLGHPVDHSRSPQLHNAWFEQANLISVYERTDIHPDDLIQEAPSLPYQWAGMNVTTPHKVAILGYVDTVDGNAKMAGAANLLYRNERGAWTAGNTDGQGFIAAFKERFGESVTGRDVLILGAGGAARSISASLTVAGAASVHLANRSVDKAKAVVSATRATAAHPLHPEVLDTLDVSIDLVINTLPPQAEAVVGRLTVEPLPTTAIVADINYDVEHPALLEIGKAAGLRTLDGEPMFLWQAALSFHAWTALQPDLDLGRRILDELRGEPGRDTSTADEPSPA